MQSTEQSDVAGETERLFNMESLWAKAYEMIQDDDNYSRLLDKFKTYLQKGKDGIHPCIQIARLKQIQKLAEKKLEELPENRTSFSVGGKRIIIRESIQKAIRTITQFKALISGAVSAEPHAALAWACILGVLPDEAAADGLGKIVFLLVRYQGIQDTILSRHCGDGRQTDNTQQLTANFESKLQSTETLEVVRDIKARSQEIQNEQMSTKERDLLLSLPTASNAIFDSTDVLGAENPCLEGTQRAILTEIHEWAEDPTAEMVFWLHGLAGTGKSTVALTVADALKQRRPFTKGIDAPVRPFLGASFFFKQGDVSRNNIQAFFPTIAACLAEVFPDFKTLFAKAIEENLAIGTKAPQQQLETLIAKSFSTLDEQSLVPLRLIIIVDALDECLSRSEALCFLITSRTENHILNSFEQLPEDLHRSVLLDKIKGFDEGDDTKDDIMLYLTYTFAQLSNNHGVPKGCLTKNFDDEEARQERLDLILESTPGSGESVDNDSDVDDWEAESPKNKIDEIYRKVLSFPDRENMSPRTKQRIYNDLCMILGFLVVLFKPDTIPALKKFLPSLAQSLDRLLKKLHAIVSVPWNESTPLELAHQSFRDFILSRKRSKKLNFQVQESKMHKKLSFVVLTSCHQNFTRTSANYVCQESSSQKYHKTE
ncbi:hypothetical protein F25303_14271 [Fusarium sp. NRRL 25303]|nr:hypothetical protein F25303_14271 [Fusarium sp. NRRL 25303]